MFYAKKNTWKYFFMTFLLIISIFNCYFYNPNYSFKIWNIKWIWFFYFLWELGMQLITYVVIMQVISVLLKILNSPSVPWLKRFLETLNFIHNLCWLTNLYNFYLFINFLEYAFTHTSSKFNLKKKLWNNIFLNNALSNYMYYLFFIKKLFLKYDDKNFNFRETESIFYYI